jgi:uncharacterized protein YodC (DUF2158 family)
MAKTKTGFELGDKVKLISGGPTMAVNSHMQLDDKLQCVWFAGKKLEYGLFAQESLVAAKDDETEG